MVKNINAKNCFDTLKKLVNSQLIDVRTPREWQDDGYADLTSLKKKLYFVTWTESEDAFFNQIKNLNFKQEETLFFICRSGIRSANAVNFLINKCMGDSCYNVEGGMEYGWKALNLPMSLK